VTDGGSRPRSGLRGLARRLLGRAWVFSVLRRPVLTAVVAPPVLAGLMLLALIGVREIPYQVDLRRGETCVGCHEDLHAAMNRQWRQSRHFIAGVGCEDCHGTDHDAMLSADGQVSAETCAGRCHGEQLAQFQRSKHSVPKTGRKATLLSSYPREVGGCSLVRGCHAVRTPYDDGSSGKCSVCHPSHGFSMEVTRDPAVCMTCHSQHNTESDEYFKSIHGILYRTVGLEGGGPSCATCHMPGGNHDDGINTTDLLVTNRLEGQPNPALRFVPTMTLEEFEPRREAMLETCDQCHGRKLARKALEEADGFRRRGAYMLEEAAALVHELYDQKLLDPMPEERIPNPMLESGIALGANQLFDSEMSAAERIFYNMYMFTYAGAWRRPYHTLPALVLWHENEMLKDDLIMLRAEARRLRAMAALSREGDADVEAVAYDPQSVAASSQR